MRTHSCVHNTRVLGGRDADSHLRKTRHENAAYSRRHYPTKCQLPVTTISRMGHHYHQTGKTRYVVIAEDKALESRAKSRIFGRWCFFFFFCNNMAISAVFASGWTYHKAIMYMSYVFILFYFFPCRSSSARMLRNIGHFISSRIPGIMLSEFNYNRPRRISALLLRSILCGVTLRTRAIASVYRICIRIYTFYN